jgi:2-polyprenyl-6-methoxyphenol hydroxylase-like FAD-dependent oxidoreductase
MRFSDADLIHGWRRVVRRPDWVESLGPGGQVRSAVVAEASWPPDSPLTVIGDAAVALDPLSGAGLSFGIQSAVRAADDRGRYHEWLAAMRIWHDSQQRAVYAAPASASPQPFWARRA